MMLSRKNIKFLAEIAVREYFNAIRENKTSKLAKLISLEWEFVESQSPHARFYRGLYFIFVAN